MTCHAFNLNEIEGFTTLMCIYVFFSAMTISGFLGALPSTLQTSFGFTVTQTAALSSAYSVTKMLCTVPMSYLCGKTSIPYHYRWQVTIGGLGTLLFGFPGLLASLAETEENQYICKPPANFTFAGDDSGADRLLLDLEDYSHRGLGLSDCEPKADGSVGVFFFLIVAQMMHAIGQSAVYTLGPAHINANCTLKDAAMLISWIYMIGPLGMAAGFMVIGPMLAGGTWWKCFAFNGTVTLLLVPLYWRLPAVPHKHKETAVLNTVRRPSMMGGPPPLSTSGKVAPSNSEISAQRRPSSLGTITVQEFHVMDFQSQVKSMFTNKVWFLTVVMGSAEVFMVSAISTHGAQYFESYGGITASTATFLAGLIIVPAAAVGTVIGGIMESKRHTSLLASSWWNVKMALLSALFFILSQLLKCDQFDVVGANFDEGTTTTPECSEAGGCDCDQSYYPVCYEGQTYFSPCHAGCTDWITDDASEFMDTVNASLCSCLVVGGNLTADSIVEAGYCEEHQCANLGMILLTFFLLIMFTFMNNTPTNVVLMRCVPTEYSGLSLALNDIVDKLLGDIPGGIILGWFLDQSCKVKNYLTDPLTCDTLESCAIFDKAGMKFRVNILNGLFPKGLSFLFAYLAYKAICADPEMQKPYEASTTKTGNFRRASKLSVDLPSMKEEEEEEGEEEA